MEKPPSAVEEKYLVTKSFLTFPNIYENIEYYWVCG